jgi:hypothetical protein
VIEGAIREGHGEGAAKRGRADGQAKGRADALLKWFRARGLRISPEYRGADLGSTSPLLWLKEHASITESPIDDSDPLHPVLTTQHPEPDR